MNKYAVSFAAFVLIGTLNAAAASGSVTVKPGSLSYKQALAACPKALGAVTFTLGHARLASAPGVTYTVDTSDAGIDTATLTGAAGSATVTANAHDRTITGKNVTLKYNGQVACVAAD